GCQLQYVGRKGGDREGNRSPRSGQVAEAAARGHPAPAPACRTSTKTDRCSARCGAETRAARLAKVARRALCDELPSDTLRRGAGRGEADLTVGRPRVEFP